VLAFVARRVSIEPIVVLLSVREGCENPFATAGLPELMLEPLEEPAARDLLEAQVPGLPRVVTRRTLACQQIEAG
jgi:hypothetical protein